MFRNIPIITKNLLIINVVVFLFSTLFGNVMERYGALHFFLASDFHLYQFITYQFMHGGFAHLFFNMFALWMFGCVIENVWGPRKFIFYYIVCGIFAGICQEVTQFFTLYHLLLESYPDISMADLFTMSGRENLNGMLTIGASGAVYAILLAFGMTFPNERIFIFPLPIPIKAKWFVMIYAAIELFSAVTTARSASDGIAHMAHLGGMLSGVLLILFWRSKTGTHFNLGNRLNLGERFRQNNWYSQASGANQNRQHPATEVPRDDMEYNARKKARQEEIDKILDKIRLSGYDSLTKDEKRRLFEASHEK